MQPTDGDRFWSMDLDDTNLSDLQAWVAMHQLVGIVDEVAGGIVAYCHVDEADNIVGRMARGV